MRKRVLVQVLHAYTRRGLSSFLLLANCLGNMRLAAEEYWLFYTRTSKLGVADARQSYKYSAKRCVVRIYIYLIPHENCVVVE